MFFCVWVVGGLNQTMRNASKHFVGCLRDDLSDGVEFECIFNLNVDLCRTAQGQRDETKQRGAHIEYMYNQLNQMGITSSLMDF